MPKSTIGTMQVGGRLIICKPFITRSEFEVLIILGMAEINTSTKLLSALIILKVYAQLMVL